MHITLTGAILRIGKLHPYTPQQHKAVNRMYERMIPNELECFYCGQKGKNYLKQPVRRKYGNMHADCAAQYRRFLGFTLSEKLKIR